MRERLSHFEKSTNAARTRVAGAVAVLALASACSSEPSSEPTFVPDSEPTATTELTEPKSRDEINHELYCENPTDNAVVERICEADENQNEAELELDDAENNTGILEDFTKAYFEQLEAGDPYAVALEEKGSLPTLDALLEEVYVQQIGEIETEEDLNSYVEIPDWVQELLENDPENPPEVNEYLKTDPSDFAQPHPVDIEYANQQQGQPLDLLGPDIDYDGIKNLFDDNIDGDQYINSQDNDMDGDGIPNLDDPQPWGNMQEFPYWNNPPEYNSDNDWIIDDLDRTPLSSEFFDGNQDGHLDIFQVTKNGITSTEFTTFQEVHEEAVEQYSARRKVRQRIFDIQMDIMTSDPVDILGFRRDSDGDGVVDAVDGFAGDDYGDNDKDGIPNGRDAFHDN